MQTTSAEWLGRTDPRAREQRARSTSRPVRPCSSPTLHNGSLLLIPPLLPPLLQYPLCVSSSSWLSSVLSNHGFSLHISQNLSTSLLSWKSIEIMCNDCSATTIAELIFLDILCEFYCLDAILTFHTRSLHLPRFIFPHSWHAQVRLISYRYNTAMPKTAGATSRLPDRNMMASCEELSGLPFWRTFVVMKFIMS